MWILNDCQREDNRVEGKMNTSILAIIFSSIMAASTLLKFWGIIPYSWYLVFSPLLFLLIASLFFISLSSGMLFLELSLCTMAKTKTWMDEEGITFKQVFNKKKPDIVLHDGKCPLCNKVPEMHSGHVYNNEKPTGFCDCFIWEIQKDGKSKVINIKDDPTT